MYFSVFLFLAFLVLRGGEASLQGDYTQDESFKEWCADHCESDGDDYLTRIYPTWKKNADYVENHNRLGLSYSLALNQFAHLDRVEYSRSLLGRKHHAVHSAKEAAFSSIYSSEREPPPSSVDWRTKGVVPPVQNQGQCGDSVAIAIVHSVDSLHALQTGNLQYASIEEYIDCCTDGWCVGESYGLSNYECIVRIGGLALESVYVSPEHKCLNDTFKPAIMIKGGEFVKPLRNETALEYAVAKQPVVAAIDASHVSFQLYKSGVYYEPDCSETELDHVVLVVGYGTDDGHDYWICQNSWGTSWGMGGYVYMARNRNNNCGIATEATYPF